MKNIDELIKTRIFDVYEKIKKDFLYEMINQELREKIKMKLHLNLIDYDVKFKSNEENNPPDVINSNNVIVEVWWINIFGKKISINLIF